MEQITEYEVRIRFPVQANASGGVIGHSWPLEPVRVEVITWSACAYGDTMVITLPPRMPSADIGNVNIFDGDTIIEAMMQAARWMAEQEGEKVDD